MYKRKLINLALSNVRCGPSREKGRCLVFYLSMHVENLFLNNDFTTLKFHIVSIHHTICENLRIALRKAMSIIMHFLYLI